MPNDKRCPFLWPTHAYAWLELVSFRYFQHEKNIHCGLKS